MPSSRTATTWTPATARPCAGPDSGALRGGRTFGGGQDADLYLDQSFGAHAQPASRRDLQFLGLDYALFRDEALRRRPPPPPRVPSGLAVAARAEVA